MKKVLVLVGVAFCVQVSYAQKAVYTDNPNALFSKGKEMFIDNNFVGAINTLEEYKKISKDVRLLDEAEYIILCAQFERGKPGMENALKEYLEKNPASTHRNQISFFIGSKHFENKEWKQAAYWFSRCNMEYLTIKEQEDLGYRAAYSTLQEGDLMGSYRLFEVLSKRSRRYNEEASYYLGYIDFQNRQYPRALAVFKLLKNKPKYKEKATLFLIQGEFLQGNLENVIKEGEAYISEYPETDSSAEIFRLLGNSHYRLGHASEAMNNYQKYLALEENPLREDMYQLADLYYRGGRYSETINTLKLVASTEDELGQAGNMLLGQAYLKLNDTASAMLAFDTAARVSFSPSVSEKALYNYVMLLVSSGSVSTFGESITALQSFLIKYPSSEYSKEINSTLANTLLSVKNYQMALDAIAKVSKPGKPLLEAKQIILYRQGVQNFVDGKLDIALNNFNEVLKMDPLDADAFNESYFWRGDIKYRKGDYNAAIKDYAHYTKLVHHTNPNYSLVFYNLGYAYFQVKDYNSALMYFNKYVAAAPDKSSVNYPDAMNRIGDCYLFNRNFSQAENYYANAMSTSPQSADYSEFQKAFVLGLQRNYAGKVGALDAMMRKYPDSPYYDNALFEKSRALVMQNKESEAITVLEKLLREHPQTTLAPKAGVQLGQLYFNINKSQEALTAYKRVVTDYPNTPEARTSIKSMEGVYKDINDIGSYATYLRSLGGANTLSSTRQDSLTYLAAENVYMKNRHTEAKTALNNYLRAYPNGVFTSDANFYLGNMAFENKDYANALNNFQEVIKSNNPKYMDDALILASGIQFDQKLYAAAYQTYQHLSNATTSPKNKHVAQLGMLRCSYLTNKDNEVVTAANQLLANPQLSADNSIEAMFYRGRSLKNLNRGAEAIKDFSTVASRTRSVMGAESQYLIAETYFDAQEYDKVITQAQAFMKAGTTHEYWMARVIIILSDAYAAKGDKFQAKQYLESLQANYKGAEKDIKAMLTKRLQSNDQE